MADGSPELKLPGAEPFPPRQIDGHQEFPRFQQVRHFRVLRQMENTAAAVQPKGFGTNFARGCPTAENNSTQQWRLRIHVVCRV